MNAETKDARGNEASDIASGARTLSGRIASMLIGVDPRTVGFVLADLTSVWIIAHEAGMREGLIDLHVTAIRNLMRINEKDLQVGEGTKS